MPNAEILFDDMREGQDSSNVRKKLTLRRFKAMYCLN
jgi:hypothetical protein